MTLIVQNRAKLTHDEGVRETHHGMAHFSDWTLNKQCGACRFFGLPGRAFPDMSEQPCAKFVTMSGWKLKKCPPRIPKTAIACKYFEPKD